MTERTGSSPPGRQRFQCPDWWQVFEVASLIYFAGWMTVGTIRGITNSPIKSTKLDEVALMYTLSIIIAIGADQIRQRGNNRYDL